MNAGRILLLSLIFASLIAGCAKKTAVGSSVWPTQQLAAKKSFLIQAPSEDQRSKEMKRIIANNLVEKGYLSSGKEPDFIVTFHVRETLTRKGLQHTRHRDFYGQSGATQHHGAAHIAANVWELDIRFINPVSGKPIFEVTSKKETTKQDLLKNIHELLVPMMERVPEHKNSE